MAAFDYGFFDQVADTLSGEGTDVGRKRRQKQWEDAKRASETWEAASMPQALISASGTANMNPNSYLTSPSPKKDSYADRVLTPTNRWIYDAAMKRGDPEDVAIARALGQPLPGGTPSAIQSLTPSPGAPAPDPYDRWLNDPFIQRARQRLDERYAAEESRVNPYSTDSPAFRAMVEGQQGQARLQFAPGAQRMLNNMTGMGATSGGVAASRAAYSGGAARALADIATSAAEKQYENQQAFEDRRSAAMQRLAGDAASVGLGVTGQGIGVTSTQQALTEGRRQFDATMANRQDEFSKTYAQASQAQKDQLALAYSQLSQQAKQFADQLDFSRKTTLSAQDQLNLGYIQAIATAAGGVLGQGVSAIPGAISAIKGD